MNHYAKVGTHSALRGHRGNTVFCRAVTSVLSQRLLHKMTNSTKGSFDSSFHVRWTSRIKLNILSIYTYWYVSSMHWPQHKLCEKENHVTLAPWNRQATVSRPTVGRPIGRLSTTVDRRSVGSMADGRPTIMRALTMSGIPCEDERNALWATRKAGAMEYRDFSR